MINFISDESKKFSFRFIYLFIFMSVLPVYMGGHYVCTLVLLRPEEGLGFSGVMDGCELLYGCWELNLDSL